MTVDAAVGKQPCILTLGGSDGKESACNAADLGLILDQEDPLEKGMATHSSNLAWRLPRTEESGGDRSHWVAKSGTLLSH